MDDRCPITFINTIYPPLSFPEGLARFPRFPVPGYLWGLKTGAEHTKAPS